MVNKKGEVLVIQEKVGLTAAELKSYKDTAETKLEDLHRRIKKADRVSRGENEYLKRDKEKLQYELNRVKLEAEIAGEK